MRGDDHARNGHDEPEIEALRVDRYLESILVARDRGARLAPHDARLDPALRVTVDQLSAELIRVHPSFRFEERLARRLADFAATIRLPAVAGGETSPPTRLMTAGGPGLDRAFDPGFDPGDLLDPAHPSVAGEPFGGHARPLLIGGALTSAAVSLAGVAFVAWRLSRPVHPMVRAIRAIHGGVARATSQTPGNETSHESGLA